MNDRERALANAKTHTYQAILFTYDLIKSLEHYHGKFQNIIHLEEAKKEAEQVVSFIELALEKAKEAEQE